MQHAAIQDKLHLLIASAAFRSRSTWILADTLNRFQAAHSKSCPNFLCGLFQTVVPQPPGLRWSESTYLQTQMSDGVRIDVKHSSSSASEERGVRLLAALLGQASDKKRSFGLHYVDV